MGVSSLPKTVTRQRRDCDLNPGPSVPESSMLTTQLPSHPYDINKQTVCMAVKSKIESRAHYALEPARGPPSCQSVWVLVPVAGDTDDCLQEAGQI